MALKSHFWHSPPTRIAPFPPELDPTPSSLRRSPYFGGGVWFTHWVRTGGGVDAVAVVCSS